MWTPGLLLALLAQDGAAPSAADLEFFEQRVRPVLVEHCYSCHDAGLVYLNF